jgi:SAM-dependent methyltransferase
LRKVKPQSARAQRVAAPYDADVTTYPQDRQRAGRAVGRLTFACAYALGRGCERAAQVFFYAAAGATRFGELRRAIQRQWDAAGAVGWDPYTYSGLLPWEEDFYFRFLKPGERLLVAGCGTGRELIALVERGFPAEGVDIAPGCVQLARRALAVRDLVGTVHACPIEELSVPNPFDVVILATQLYSMIPQSETRISMLRRVGGHLAPGGRILLSYIVRRGRQPRPLLTALARLTGTLTGADWRPEYGDVMIPVGGGDVFSHYEHRFLPEEIEGEVRRAGLRVAAHEPDDVGKLVLLPSTEASP